MSKKRKFRDDGEVVKIGNKAISLDGYLAKKTKNDDPVTRKPEEQAEVDTPTHDEARNSHQTPGRKSDAVRSCRTSGFAADRADQGDPHLLPARRKLPIWAHKNDIRRILRQHDVLLLVGETGSGKSTQVPQFLFEEDWCQKRKVKVKNAHGREQEIAVGGMIAITQPRRVAATTLAHRVSREAGIPLNAQKGGNSDVGPQKGLVGYSVRFDHNIPRGTRIKFMTEGMLLQELLRDPHLRQYSAIVVDEIHERSMDVDLLSGFLKQIITGDKSGRGGIPLKVVIMSATANVDPIRNFFSSNDARNELEKGSSQPSNSSDVQFLRIPGRQFPVQIIHEPKPVPDIQEALLKTLCKIHTEESLPGDVLAFLTGQEEIEATQKLMEEYAAKLASDVPKLKVFPLFGQLSIEAQHHAFQPIKGGFTRKIILATNIAETSVTVPGVRYVVDCGKAKVKQYRSRLGMESLLAKPISKSSAIQRAGRAGREGPGKCYRLYTEESFGALQDVDFPEILRNDVIGAVLTMKARGIDDILSFPLMDVPDLESIEKALIHLHLLGALSDDGSITETGRKMVLFPVSAPYAKALLTAADPSFDCVLEVIDIVSCITSGDDVFHQIQSEEVREETEVYRKELYRREGDLITYLTAMQHYAVENSNRTEWCKLRKINLRNMRQAWNIRKQLRGLCQKEKLIESVPDEAQAFSPISPDRASKVLQCFLRGFALKTAMLAPDSSYVTTHGKHVVAIHPSSVLHGQKREAIMFLEHVFTQKNYAKKVSIIEAQWIAEALEGVA